MLLTLLYSESAYPITPVERLKSILYDYSGIGFILFTLMIHINNSKFTYDKCQNCEIRI